ncbi:unnamed protein product [Wuchereria bancrofti]|uniref:Uncharacterized protein n=2 Tax=Wuchereria bancrofti TaxID=6293 RepID=A0A3P7FDR4_WUCBA|nr:unnamed protein product [Wuchereria bancrofti]
MYANQFKLDTFRLFDALDKNLQENLLTAIPNDTDHTPKPQRFQDFLQAMQISNRLNTKLVPTLISSTGKVVVESDISQIHPSMMKNLSSMVKSKLQSQIAQQILSQRQQSLLSSSISSKLSQADRAGIPQQRRIIRPLSNDQFQQNPHRKVPISLQQQQQQQQQFLPLQQTTNFRRNIARNFVKSEVCVDFDPFELCMQRRALCRISRRMRLRCRKVCHFC